MSWTDTNHLSFQSLAIKTEGIALVLLEQTEHHWPTMKVPLL